MKTWVGPSFRFYPVAIVFENVPQLNNPALDKSQKFATSQFTQTCGSIRFEFEFGTHSPRMIEPQQIFWCHHMSYHDYGLWHSQTG